MYPAQNGNHIVFVQTRGPVNITQRHAVSICPFHSFCFLEECFGEINICFDKIRDLFSKRDDVLVCCCKNFQVHLIAIIKLMGKLF